MPLQLRNDISTRVQWSREWKGWFFHLTIRPVNTAAPAVSTGSPV
jgi:hypothetical protein